MSVATVGIPRALAYYIYFPRWRSFLNELGVNVVTSGLSNRQMLDEGVKEALAEACVPIKLYFGHVLSLKDKADYIFVPRLYCLNSKTLYCPKFLGLPDMIKHSLNHLPPIIDTMFNNRYKGFLARRTELAKSFFQLGSKFTNDKLKILKAFYRSLKTEQRYLELLQSGLLPNQAIAVLGGAKNVNIAYPEDSLKFAVLGYPYHLYDDFINVGVLTKLRRLGVQVVTTENLPPGILARQKHPYPKDMFWTFSDRAFRAALHFFREGRVDGIIYVTAFGCGPDAMVYRLIEMESKKYPHIPFMILMIDEHSGEAGISTRLEAFTDMVRRRKKGV
ncbi:Predicted nucleotide-binding protein, sugar kinase/HSP70/actin superfamily [Desulforamulus putei DSM 12395]|uniref:Predicted nucleotide-binding protein, sugar kinase/HSP70/actin superfamily n=1 Tax=Desulforamulus putei DSM 12395 TaxID=1121429 RepID=A0A1M4T9X6_9FIRM|nr:acyl-CoA dehydratase activase-related protein [Desulforamulus putei]SHE41047.1 Predicted nucleotide-binding protein, sugar kinase/HSP70/actin superfamily [Desulforamulus putei DSM 12395]